MQVVRVAALRHETPEIISLDLVARAGETLTPAPPGSHIDVGIGAANGAIAPLMRQYSLCQAPDEQGVYRIGIKLEANSRGGSRWLHESVREGDELRIGAPRNNFSLAQGAGLHILVAGGIGITPILSMAQHLAARGEEFELHYFVRSVEHAAFASQLQRSAFSEKVTFHVGVAPSELESVAKRFFATRPKADAHLYVCGPAPFMSAIEAAAGAWPTGSVHREYFGAAAGQQAANGAFTIRLARSCKELVVPAGIPIVEVLEASGIPIDTSCRQGACGTCMVNVLAGTPDHRDSFLLPEEQKEGRCIITCVSRSVSPTLVLDL